MPQPEPDSLEHRGLEPEPSGAAQTLAEMSLHQLNFVGSEVPVDIVVQPPERLVAQVIGSHATLNAGGCARVPPGLPLGERRLASSILVLEPLVQRFEVLDHRLAVELTAGRLLQRLPPGSARSRWG